MQNIARRIWENGEPVFRFQTNHLDLNGNETRMLLLTKMGLRDRETCAMLGMAITSVKKLRYRLRKKTGLEEEELLERLR